MVGLVAAVALGVGAALVITGGGEEASAQTVRFQKPTEPGPDPFTPPSDVPSGQPAQPSSTPAQPSGTPTQPDQVGSGPYGGTGSDLVCDRELLIRSLHARPDRMAEWARVRGIDPSPESVASYIRSLRPVTLTRDTRVTNYSFEDGKAVGFQSILQANTAVLVDKYGEPVVRCRCGNPLTKPVYYEKAKCLYCPPHYKPPPYCYYRYRKTNTYTTDTSGYDRSYQPYSNCWRLHPKPPPVRASTTRAPRTRPPPQPQPPPTQTYTQEPDRRAPYTYTEDTQTQTQTTDGGTTGGGTTGGGTTGGGAPDGGTPGGGTTGGGTTGGGP